MASFSDNVMMLLLTMPMRVKSGNGGTGCACTFGKFGSRGCCVAGSVGAGCGLGMAFTPGGAVIGCCCVPGGAVGGGVGDGSPPGGCVAGLTGVGVGVWAATPIVVKSRSASTDALVASLIESIIEMLLFDLQPDA